MNKTLRLEKKDVRLNYCLYGVNFLILNLIIVIKD